MPFIKFYLNGVKYSENHYNRLTYLGDLDISDGIYKLDLYRNETYMKPVHFVKYKNITKLFDKNMKEQINLFEFSEYVNDLDKFKIYINDIKGYKLYIFNFKINNQIANTNTTVDKYKIESKTLDIYDVVDEYYVEYYFYDIVSKNERIDDFVIRYDYEIKLVKKKKEFPGFFEYMWKDIRSYFSL